MAHHQPRLLDLPTELLLRLAADMNGKDLVHLMLSCRAMCRLIDEHWAAVAPPGRGGSVTVVVDSVEQAEAWTRFFRRNKAPQPQPQPQPWPQMQPQMQFECLYFTQRLVPGLAETEALQSAIADTCGASLSELWLNDTRVPRPSWLARFSALRSLSLRLDTLAVLHMDFRALKRLETLYVCAVRETYAVGDLLLPGTLHRLELSSLEDMVVLESPAAFCRSVAALPNLRELRMAEWSNLACEELRGTGLTRLQLEQRFMGAGAGWEAGWGAPGGMDCLPPTLRRLGLEGQEWNDGGVALRCMEPLGRLTGLTALSLNENGVATSGAMLQCLAPLTGLQRLDLTDDNFSPATLAPLARLPALTSLRFCADPALAASGHLPPGFDPDLAVLKRMQEVVMFPCEIIGVSRADIEPLCQTLRAAGVRLLDLDDPSV